MKQIGTLGTIDTITVGGRVLTDVDPSRLIILFATNSTDQDAGAIKMGFGATSAYQVTAGKTLRIYAIRLISQNTTANSVDVGYSDSAVAIGGQAGSPTNPVYASSGSSDSWGLTNSIPSSGGIVELAVDAAMIQNKFVHIHSGTANTLYAYLYGYEV